MSEEAKRLLDWGAAAAWALSLSQISTILTIVLTIMGIVWYGVRFFDRFIAKKPSDE